MKKMQKKARQDSKGGGKEGEGDKEKLSVKEEEPSKFIQYTSQRWKNSLNYRSTFYTILQ